MMGTGTTIDNPMSLADALVSENIKAGDTINLRGGTYKNSAGFTSKLAGKVNLPIILQAYPGERPIIDAGLVVNGGYLRFMGIEFMRSEWQDGRESQQEGWPTDIRVPRGLDAFSIGSLGDADGLEFIHCIFHDNAQGLAWYSNGGMMYGCLSYYNGWKCPFVSEGHGAYIQNGGLQKVLKDNFIFDNFGWGIHAYASVDNKLDNITLEGNTCFNNGSLFGEAIPNLMIGGGYQVTARTPIVKENMTYRLDDAGQNAIGLFGHAMDVTFVDNYTPEHTSLDYVDNFLVNTGNFDGPSPKSGKRIFVIPDDYQSDRANVTIYNYDLSDTVIVDLTAIVGLIARDMVQVRNVQDYFVDIQMLVLDGDKRITVNMQAQNRSVALPQNWVAPKTSFPKFGAFVIEKV